MDRNNDQNYGNSKTSKRANFRKIQNPNESNNEMKPTNNSKNSTNSKTLKNQRNNNWNRHNTTSKSCAKTSINFSYDIEKQYMDSIKRHLNYLKQEQEKINNKCNAGVSSFEKQNMFLKNRTRCTESNDPINTGKIQFSKIYETRGTIPSNLKNILQRKSKLNNMNRDMKIDYQKLKSIEIKSQLEKKIRKSDKLPFWRVIKNLKNKDINKCEEPKNDTKLCVPFPANNVNVTVSLEQSPLIQEILTTDKVIERMIQHSCNDLIGLSNKKSRDGVQNEQPNVEQLSSLKTNILAQNLQCMLERSLSLKPILNDLNTHKFNELNKKLINTLSELTTKSKEIKKQDLEQLIQINNEQVTVEYFNIISTSNKLSSISSADSISSKSLDDVCDPPNVNQKSSDDFDNVNTKTKKRVSIRISKDSQSGLLLSNATASKTTNADTKQESLSMDGNESMTEIELALLKRKHHDALQKIRSEYADSNESMDVSKSILSLAAVDSIILTKKEALRRKLLQNSNKTSGKCKAENETNDEKIEAIEDCSFESAVYPTSYLMEKRKSCVHSLPEGQGLSNSTHEDFLYPSISHIINFDPDKSNKKLSVYSPLTPKEISSSNNNHAEKLILGKNSTINILKLDTAAKSNKCMSMESSLTKNKQTNEKTNGSSPVLERSLSLLNDYDYEPKKTSTSASINVKDDSVNLRRNSSGESFYLKRSEVDFNKKFSQIIFLENEESAKNNSTKLEKLPDSDTSLNIPSLSTINAKLKKIDLVDDSPLSETERFNLILDSYTTLEKLIDKSTENELREGLPTNVLRNSKVFSNELQDCALKADKLNSNSKITKWAFSSKPAEFTSSENHTHLKRTEPNVQLVGETITTAIPKEIKSMKTGPFHRPGCNCQDKLQTLTEEILKKADCECVKQGKDNILEKCTCIQKTDKLQSIQVVCGHISHKDKCLCKIDSYNRSQIKTKVGSSSSTSLNKDLSQVFSAPIKVEENLDIDLNPEQIGACFRRGFRADNIALSDANCLIKRGEEKLLCIRSNLTTQPKQIGVNFSEQRTPLDFLIALGFSVDEASIALRNEVVKNRLNAAITEARIWCNFIKIPQGTLLYLLAYKARPSTMRYFLQMVEAIINSRIPDAVKLDGFIKLLDKLASGHLPMKLIFGIRKMKLDQDDGRNVQQQLARLFENMHQIAAKEAALLNRKFTQENKKLLEHLTTYYRPGLYNHLETIAKYVGRGQLTSVVQMEAAIIYLSRMVKASDVNYEEFENYCGMNQTNS